MGEKSYAGLVLAANRRGALDPLANAGGVSHKAFIDVAGVPMLRRVVDAMAESGRIAPIVVSIEEESTAEAQAILSASKAKDRIIFVGSKATIGASVAAVTEANPALLPLVITTGDNALHTAEMVRFFCDALDDVGEDAALGLTEAHHILEKYPEGNRAFHRFKDGQFSSCNLYALLTPRALNAPRTFNSGGQFGKKPWRLIFSFGLIAFLVYKSRLTTLRTFLGLLSRSIKVSTVAVFMPFAEGPIDIDRMQDWELAEKIIRSDEGTRPK